MEKKKINLHFEVIESPKQKRAKEKKENRRDLLLTIATFLVITSIIAGIHVCKIWYSPAPASDFDLFLFFYFIIGLALGLLTLETLILPQMTKWDLGSGGMITHKSF